MSGFRIKRWLIIGSIIGAAYFYTVNPLYSALCMGLFFLTFWYK